MFKLGNLLRRAYFSPKDMGIWKHDMMVWTVPNLINCRQSLEFLQANEGQIPPKIIGDLMRHLSRYQIPLDEHWPELCKQVKNIITDFNRFVITDLSIVIRAMAELGETNQEFWDLVETKLINEGLSRYLSESEAAQLIWGLCKVGKGSDELWKRLENEVSRYYLSLDTHELKDAVYGLEVSGKGNQEVLLKLKSRLRATELELIS